MHDLYRLLKKNLSCASHGLAIVRHINNTLKRSVKRAFPRYFATNALLTRVFRVIVLTQSVASDAGDTRVFNDKQEHSEARREPKTPSPLYYDDECDDNGSRLGGRAVMSDPIHEAVSAAVEEVLQPLAQLAMEMQIGASDFIRLIEQTFIRAVEQDAALAGRSRPGASAVAARSGLTRQRVSQLRSTGAGKKSQAFERQPQTLRILSAWKMDPRFSDRFGVAKVLPVRGPVSFNALVKRHGSGLRARSILKELERIKAVRFTKERHVEMIQRADLDDARKAQAIRDLGEFGREFLETLTHNVLNPETPRYHRRVVGRHVKDQEVPRLIRDAASQAGVWALALQDAITDNSVTVKPGPSAQKATRLSGQFFISEKPSVVQAVARLRPKRALSMKGRKVKQG